MGKGVGAFVGLLRYFFDASMCEEKGDTYRVVYDFVAMKIHRIFQVRNQANLKLGILFLVNR